MADNDAFAATDKALTAKTGRNLASWVEVAKGCPASGHMATVAWLKTDHGLGHGHANSVVHALNASAAVSQAGGDLVNAMFAGPKAAMRPVHEAVVAVLSDLGSDIELAPKKSYVSFRRSKQFALGQPSTKDRYDLGLILKGEPASDRLEPSGSWNAMVSHRVRLSSPEQVDAEVRTWLKAAYDRA